MSATVVVAPAASTCATLGRLGEGPRGGASGCAGPFKSLPLPSWGLARLPLCKQASCPCITWLHKKVGNRPVHPAATCPRLSVGPARGAWAPRWPRVAARCSSGPGDTSTPGAAPSGLKKVKGLWPTGGRGGVGRSHCSEGETEAQRGHRAAWSCRARVTSGPCRPARASVSPETGLQAGPFPARPGVQPALKRRSLKRGAGPRSKSSRC